MEKVIERLTQISTVSKSDIRAVMGNLSIVMAEYMDLGYSVKIDDLGSFYYTACASKNGVATKEEVSAKQIVATRVQFIPEFSRGKNNATTRVMANSSVNWQLLPGIATTDADASGEGDTDNGTSSGGSDLDDNPLG